MAGFMFGFQIDNFLSMLEIVDAPSTGLAPPAGYVFLTDDDGAILTDADNAYLIEAL